MIKIAICEPDHSQANVLEGLVSRAGKLLPERLETEVYLSGEDFINGLEQGESFGLVYMNMDMGDMDGVALGKKLRERFSSRETLLVYLSDRLSFDGEVFSVQPFLTVKTPVDDKDFMRKLFSATEALRQADDLFIIKQGRTTYQIKRRDIICLESVGRDIILSSSGREDIQYREALKNEQEKFQTVNFIKPHLSYIVNLDFVEQYKTDCLILTNKKQVPISELRMREIKQAVLNFWEYRNIQ